jgi:hypothetical protein
MFHIMNSLSQFDLWLPICLYDYASGFNFLLTPVPTAEARL